MPISLLPQPQLQTTEPATVAEQKIKKQGEQISISLEKNPDIVATVAAADGLLCCGVCRRDSGY